MNRDTAKCVYCPVCWQMHNTEENLTDVTVSEQGRRTDIHTYIHNNNK